MKQSRTQARSAAALLIALVCLASASGRALAQPAADATAPESLQFLPIEVRQSDWRDWPRFGYEFESLPMRRDEFDRLLQEAGVKLQSSSDLPATVATAHM
ncbi:MAG: hypothetical protein KDA41_08755, partial [Planctomycetales bacterium]|nr:hypothetical protein [Planctomycetales bacterium]